MYFSQLVKLFRGRFTSMEVINKHLYGKLQILIIFCQFFHVPCPNVYNLLDKCNQELQYIESEWRYLKDSTIIFATTMPADIEILKYINEAKLVKVKKKIRIHKIMH